MRSTTQHSLFVRVLTGTLAGFVATAPMTATMEALHDRLPWWQRYPLPPKRIVNRFLKQVGIRRADTRNFDPLTLAAHASFGAAGGAVYGLVEDSIYVPAPLKGALFGILVWIVSYMGWIPSADILAPAHKHPRGRRTLMIFSHLVWGAGLGILTDLLQQAADQLEEQADAEPA